MSKFDEKYTTTERKTADEQGEQGKVIVSNDAYAIGDAIQSLIDNLETLRRSSIK